MAKRDLRWNLIATSDVPSGAYERKWPPRSLKRNTQRPLAFLDTISPYSYSSRERAQTHLPAQLTDKPADRIVSVSYPPQMHASPCDDKPGNKWHNFDYKPVAYVFRSYLTFAFSTPPMSAALLTDPMLTICIFSLVKRHRQRLISPAERSNSFSISQRVSQRTKHASVLAVMIKNIGAGN